MFSNKSKDKDTGAATAPVGPAAMQAKRMPRSSSAPSIISADLTVTGTLASTGDIQIDGRVEGDVHSAGLVIGDKAFIHGDVTAEEVTVRGRVQGSVRARKVLLASTCHVEGNILHEAFAVETGAFFEGNCRHADNPLADEAPKKPEFRAAPAPIPSAPAAAPAPAAPSAVSSMVSRPMTTGATAATFTPLKAN
ncbi:MAG: polymer-forming cytoskeletal protein [Alphaproteobacteria bacterium]|nr:polymer-forming cytoskeletal protein [Alphaproteobacteria bacterium]MDE2110840.1 polymer-forming cytoskeletal protein [Alphaproteobacteria bacterium]MDE2495486.1 polymer-forming cytoskeletal protein [Alphaproteobacteria bacterium]